METEFEETNNADPRAENEKSEKSCDKIHVQLQITRVSDHHRAHPDHASQSLDSPTETTFPLSTQYYSQCSKSSTTLRSQKV